MTHAHGSSYPEQKFDACPLPKTHRRLADAHLLWHQTLDGYHDADAFRANLNATIEALRNVTFVLQNEKAAFSRFDEWYGPWQDRLKADPVARWLHGARTTVVHQGELESHSSAEVRLVTWRDVVLARLSVPTEVPSPLILRNLPLLGLFNEAQITPSEAKDAAIQIERRWTTADLDGVEVLEALGRAYGLLSDLVLDAHTRLGRSACIPSGDDHPHFRSTYHRTGTLECMLAGAQRRTQTFELATGGELILDEDHEPGDVDPAIALLRYGMDHRDLPPAWETLDPVRIADRVLHQAKRILRKDRRHVRMMLIRDGQGEWHIRVLHARDRAEKELLMRMVARFVERKGCDAILEVGEMWATRLQHSPGAAGENSGSAGGKEELLFVMVATREGLCRKYLTPFTRGPLGGIRLGSTGRTEGEYPFYFRPVVEVWRRQGLTQLRNGKAMRRVWEPDALDICFCGGPKRFAECCRLHIPNPSDIRDEIRRAFAASDYGRAEELSRAVLAQYVIWIRQHTVPTMNVAHELYKEMVAVDIPALESLVRTVQNCMVENGNSELLVPQLLHLAATIGAPEFSVRLIALAAEWLVESGRIEEAILQIDGLGEPERVDDSLALIVAVHTLELSAERRERLLRRAISAALTREEELTAELALAEHLIVERRGQEALAIVDSIIVGPPGTERPTEALAGAIILRWRVTGDGVQLLHTVEEAHDPGLAVLCAEILLREGMHSEAERVLASAVGRGDAVAKLLSARAMSLRGDATSARDLFLSIEPERLPDRFRYTHAITAGELAISLEDERLRQLALPKLEELADKVAPGRSPVQDMLTRLRSAGVDKQSPE